VFGEVTMKTITKYVADDGCEFNTPDECEKHEQLIEACNDAMGMLPPRPSIPHGQFMQRDRIACLRAKRGMFTILVARWGESYPEMNGWKADEVHPGSFAGRLASESAKPIASAWWRLSCIDFDTGREYDQPYFANNPGEARGEYVP